MNVLRFAVATTVLVMLCGPAGAETVTGTTADPLAVPVSSSAPAGARAAMPWTAERQAKAQPRTLPLVDPAAVIAASGHFRRGAGPQGTIAALLPVADDAGPIGSEVSPGGERAADYWTPERMRAAKPMPMPVIPGDGPGNPVKPRNR